MENNTLLADPATTLPPQDSGIESWPPFQLLTNVFELSGAWYKEVRQRQKLTGNDFAKLFLTWPDLPQQLKKLMRLAVDWEINTTLAYEFQNTLNAPGNLSSGELALGDVYSRSGMLWRFLNHFESVAKAKWAERQIVTDATEMEAFSDELEIAAFAEPQKATALEIKSLLPDPNTPPTTEARITTVPPTSPAVPSLEPSGYFSPTDIAKALNAYSKRDAIRKALKRMFDDNLFPDSAWIENNDPAKGQARILYKLSAVRALLTRYEPDTKA